MRFPRRNDEDYNGGYDVYLCRNEKGGLIKYDDNTGEVIENNKRCGIQGIRFVVGGELGFLVVTDNNQVKVVVEGVVQISHQVRRGWIGRGI